MRKNIKNLLFLFFVFGFLVPFFLSCGGDGPIFGTIEITDTSNDGDFNVSGTYYYDPAKGSLVLSLGSVRDPENPAEVLSGLDESNITITVDSVNVNATIEDLSDVAADLVFIFDTTGSMGEEIAAVVNSVDAFSTAIDAALDARFALVSYGDAFSTKWKEFSLFTYGAGAWEPPSFDIIERPYTDVGGLTAFKNLLDELLAYYGGGLGYYENGYGALNWAEDSFTFRSDAQRHYILLTDAACYYADYYADGIVDQWIPPNPNDLIDKLAGKATVHVVGPSESGQGDPKLLSDGTGGIWLQMPFDGNINLNTLGLDDAVSSGYLITFSIPGAGTYTIRVTIEYGDFSGWTEWVLTLS